MLAATGISAALVPVSRALARGFRILDDPGHRKIHNEPMPRLGGVAVFVSFTGLVLVGYLLIPSLSASAWAQEQLGVSLTFLREAYRVEAKLMAVLVGGALAFLIGLLDDIYGGALPRLAQGWAARSWRPAS